MSDVFLFKAVGLRISVNGDHHLEEITDIAIEGPETPVWLPARLCGIVGMKPVRLHESHTAPKGREARVV
jgi:hypothetical protein